MTNFNFELETLNLDEMADVVLAFNFIDKHEAEILQLSSPSFFSLLCVLAETYCKANGEDVCDMVDMMNITVHEMNPR